MKPTGARIEMLQAVADGAVTEHFPILPEPNWSQWDRGPGWGPRYRKVSARVEELRREGFVKLLPRADGSHYKSPRQWDITPAGRRWLEAHGGAS